MPEGLYGITGKAHEQEAIVMHATLPGRKVLDVGIINIFKQGVGDTLTFAADGFSCTDVIVKRRQEKLRRLPHGE